MKAYRMLEWKQPAQLVDVPIPEPGPGEVLLKVAGNGICQSDLHLMHEWEASPPHLQIELPMTIGHEIGGWVEASGPGVIGFERGQPCLVTQAGCGRCRPCAEGWNNYCQNLGKQPGMGMDGGLAEYVVVPAAGLVPVQGDPTNLAPLVDAGLSSWHAVKRVASLLSPGSTAVVIGVGGLGHMAVAEIKAAFAARVIAVDVSEEALALASELGADKCILSDEHTLESIGRRCVDTVLDFVGAGATVALAANLIRPQGHIVIVGRGGGSFNVLGGSLPIGAMISTTFGGSKLELMELISMAETGQIRPHVSNYSLDEVEQAFELLKAGKIRGRAIIVP